MQKIDAFFDRIRNLIKDDSSVKALIADIFQTKYKLLVSAEDVTLKEGIIFIKGRPALKNEISLRKRMILEDIKNALPAKGKHFSDIR